MLQNSGVADASEIFMLQDGLMIPPLLSIPFHLTSAGGYDVFLAKFDANGNVIWVKSAGGTGSDLANSVAVDDTGMFIWPEVLRALRSALAPPICRMQVILPKMCFLQNITQTVMNFGQKCRWIRI
ncbi:MAG: hypothetical protein IPH20_12845 [Bacteroidales bacterium]|nr:hypothetical protein [Bacteroidales bacterium]